jgi:hypothetical protein
VKSLRLEEVLRILCIALISALVGTGVFVRMDALHASSGTRFDPLVGSMLALIMFAVAFAVSVIVGFLLHLILRMRPMPKILMLPLFLIAGYLSGRVVAASWFGTIPLSVAISFTAWVLYVRGPFKLWGFNFDAGKHRDF